MIWPFCRVLEGSNERLGANGERRGRAIACPRAQDRPNGPPAGMIVEECRGANVEATRHINLMNSYRSSTAIMIGGGRGHGTGGGG